MQAHELDRVVSAMSELPERQLTALKLSALEGRSLEEIGDALDVGAETAKSLVARSRRTLTHRLAAADLDCGEARMEMESATLRGVRLTGMVSLHLEHCRACARAHRSIRRRRRVALLIPFGLIVRTAGLRDKVRDVIAFNPAWEVHATAAKMCTAACLTAVGTGAAAAPTVTVAVPLVVQTATPTPRAAELVPAKKKQRKKPKPTPTATVVAQSTPAWTPTAAPEPTVAAKKQQVRSGKLPSVVMAGSGESAPTVKKTPTPVPTPVATPTAPPPQPTPPPAQTPVATPAG
jgi:hypothetical protein